MHQLVVQWAGYVVPWIELLGVVIVLWAVINACASLVQRGWSVLRRHAVRKELNAIRLAMGEKMVLGLELFLAGDIIQTIVVPSWESLAILGGIVVIRTVLVYFLHMELKQGTGHVSAGKDCGVIKPEDAT